MDSGILQVVLVLIAVFAGVLNTFLAFFLYLIWGEFKSLRSKQDKDIQNVFNIMRKNKEAADKEMKEIRTEFAEIDKKLTVLINANA